MLHWIHQFKSSLPRLPLFSALSPLVCVTAFCIELPALTAALSQLHRDRGGTAGVNVSPARVPLETVPVFCLD